MNDNPAPPLNLIERMAQRLEKEAAGVQPAGTNVIGRAMERDALDADQAPKNSGTPVMMREPVQVQNPTPRRDGVSAVGPAADALRPPAAARPTEQVRVTPPPRPRTTVRLHFRASRPNGCL